MPVTTWEADRFSVPMSQGVMLQRAAGQVTEKVGYIFRPSEAGLGVLFAGFQHPDTDPAVYYVLARTSQQAEALIAEHVAPIRIAALAQDQAELDQYRRLGIPGDNIFELRDGETIDQVADRAYREVEQWLRVLDGAAIVTTPAVIVGTADQIIQWLDSERWVSTQALTANIAETIARINQMA
ncbi:MAG: hypothetical protein HY600_06690 [Candidatus Omnitrophica bacterium]|nr:hypothetical protein [Candidatus Omnitrophota bacterium]